MKIIDYITDDCPDYALSYLVNGDSSGIEDSDQEAADQWVKECEERLIDLYPGCTVTFDTKDEEPSFTRHPAFGLSCNTVPCAFIALVPDDYDFGSYVELGSPWEDED